MSSSFGYSSIDNVGNALYSSALNRQSLAASALNRGAQAAQARNYDLALTEFNRAHAYNPQDGTVYRYIGQVYGMMGKSAEAIDAYRRGLKMDPANDNARLDLANAYVEAKQWNDAEKEFLQLAKTNPGNPQPPTTLGYIYLNQDRLAEADTQFTRVIQMAPSNSTAYYNLGLVRNKQGRYDEARDLFQQSLSLDGRNERAYADLAYAYLGLDDAENARRQVNQLLTLGTSSAAQLALEVNHAVETPKFFYQDPQASNFNELLGSNTPLSDLDPSLATPGASKVFKMTFVFNQAMDIGSVTNPLHWSIQRANGGTGGVYNDGAVLSTSKDVNVPIVPLSVTYDPYTHAATIYFRVTQNAAGDGVLDPQHLTFSFTGTDATGRPMDKHGDQFNGAALRPF
jgi:Flp pilus assembly protein TadD